MNTLNQQIENAKNLDELLDTLNGYESDDKKLDEAIDLCSLPTFGKEPQDTMEIFSWDDDRVLIQNEYVGPAFELVERTEDFGL